MKTLKETLKTWAKEITEKKSQRKGAPSGYVSGLDRLRVEYRHHHIAYCELRGTPRERIERKYHEAPYEKWIQRVKDEVEARKEVKHEDVCSSEG